MSAVKTALIDYQSHGFNLTQNELNFLGVNYFPDKMIIEKITNIIKFYDERNTKLTYHEYVDFKNLLKTTHKTVEIPFMENSTHYLFYLGLMNYMNKIFDKTLCYYGVGYTKRDSICCYELASMYYHGIYVEKNIKIASEFVKPAVEYGFSPALVLMGDMTGDKSFYENAAKQNDPDGYYRLKYYDKAFQLYGNVRNTDFKEQSFLEMAILYGNYHLIDELKRKYYIIKNMPYNMENLFEYIYCVVTVYENLINNISRNKKVKNTDFENINEKIFKHFYKHEYVYVIYYYIMLKNRNKYYENNIAALVKNIRKYENYLLLQVINFNFMCGRTIDYVEKIQQTIIYEMGNDINRIIYDYYI